MTQPTRRTALSLLGLSGALAILLTAGAPAQASGVRLHVNAGKPLMRADRLGKNYLKVGLQGDKAQPNRSDKPPLNLALVLDRSGSMQGTKMSEAKQAALLVIDRLSANDIISIVAYDSGVQVVVPATKAQDKAMLRRAVRGLQPQGSTALFAGVSTGLAEIRKFKDDRRVNRVILLSDGQANVGPKSPNELALLGSAAGKEGISVTTIGLGLGYNEDLMARLAKASDGNHAFAESADTLAQIFQFELSDVMSVVGQEVSVKVKLPKGVRAVQLFGREGEINGSEVFVAFNQLYAGQEKYFLVELEMTGGAPETTAMLAKVEVSYAEMSQGRTVRLAATESVRFSNSQTAISSAENASVMVAAVEALAVRANREAVALRDKGDVKRARKTLQDNAIYLQQNAARYGSQRLETYRQRNEEDSKNLEGAKWNKQRKSMRKTQHELEVQQSY